MDGVPSAFAQSPSAASLEPDGIPIPSWGVAGVAVDAVEGVGEGCFEGGEEVSVGAQRDLDGAVAEPLHQGSGVGSNSRVFNLGGGAGGEPSEARRISRSPVALPKSESATEEAPWRGRSIN